MMVKKVFCIISILLLFSMTHGRSEFSRSLEQKWEILSNYLMKSDTENILDINSDIILFNEVSRTPASIFSNNYWARIEIIQYLGVSKLDNEIIYVIDFPYWSGNIQCFFILDPNLIKILDENDLIPPKMPKIDKINVALNKGKEWSTIALENDADAKKPILDDACEFGVYAELSFYSKIEEREVMYEDPYKYRFTDIVWKLYSDPNKERLLETYYIDANNDDIYSMNNPFSIMWTIEESLEQNIKDDLFQ